MSAEGLLARKSSTPVTAGAGAEVILGAPLDRLCLHHLFEHQAVRTPDGVAARSGQEWLSYRLLDARANQLAHALALRGVRPRDRVAVCLPRGLDMLVAVLAILKAGAAYVPIDGTAPALRAALILRQADPVTIVSAPAFATLLGDFAARALQWAEQAAFITAQPTTAPRTDAGPNDVAYVMFTSGSTGTPKGVEISHRAVVHHGLCLAGLHALGAADRCLFSASLAFDVSVEQIFPAWATGAEVHVSPDDLFDSFRRLDSVVRQERLTVLTLPTAIWHGWVRYLERRDLPVPPSLRAVAVGTEKALGDHLRIWLDRGGRGTRFMQGYGPTEATITCTTYTYAGEDFDDGPLPIGAAIPGAEVLLLDERLQPVAIGEVGQIHVGGVGLARGYLGRPDLTVAAFIPHPFRPGERLYRTGDMGRLRDDGQLMFLGRADGQVKIRGHRVELGEIESVLNAHPRVRESVVLLQETAAGGSVLVAFLLQAPGTLGDAELREFARHRLPDYMLPSAWVVMPAFPLTANNKVDRAALRLPVTPAVGAPESAVPGDALSSDLHRVFAEELGRHVGLQDSFFELGGDSLQAMALLDRLNVEHALDLSMDDLLAAPSVHTLAAAIRCRAARATPERADVIALRPGTGTPVYLVMGVQVYAPLVARLRATNPVYAVIVPEELAVLRDFARLPGIVELADRYVELIRRHAPAGPYVVGGFSIGGAVAYEVAQRLKACGEHVALLVMFDTVRARVRSRRPPQRLAGLAGCLPAPVLGAVRDGVETLQWALRAARHALLDRRADAGRPAREQWRILEYGRRMRAHERTIEPYPGEVVLYRAADSAFRGIPEHHGFAELVDALEVRSVQGDHTGILGPAQVGAIAADLDSRLARRPARVRDAWGLDSPAPPRLTT